MIRPGQDSLLQRIVELFLQGNLSVLLILISLIAGAVALVVTPREEEPQIIVPIADLLVNVPGASALEVERQVTTRLEKLLHQIDGVEYVYSASRPELAIVTVRFYVGEDREDSLVKLYNKLDSNSDAIPPSVSGWVVKPVEIDDVPIVNISLFSDRMDDAGLRRLAEEIEARLQSVKNTNRVFIIGGRPRTIRVELDPSRLAARSLTPLEVERAIRASNAQVRAGNFDAQNEQFLLDAGMFIENSTALGHLVIGVQEDRPVRLEDVATLIDGPSEIERLTHMGFGPAGDPPEGLDPSVMTRGNLVPAVHLAVAKKKGTNAVWVANAVESRMEELGESLLPEGVFYRITRNYGETANDKVNELIESLIIALAIVIGLFIFSMGWREALIVALAVPLTFALTLLINYLFGYSINRVTLFAMILVLGLVVDDPIVDVENIHRHFLMRKEPPFQAVLTAVSEVRPPIILATLAVIVSFLPLFFITGMMGPYMRPMALNVPVAMMMSMLVAFTVTPWLAFKMMKHEPVVDSSSEKPPDVEQSGIYRFYGWLLPIFLKSPLFSWALLGGVVLLMFWAGSLAMLRAVPLKMLPFDNKNEFQIVIDMPEGTTLETTDAVAREFADYLRTVPEVENFQTYAGTASAMDFNGMVRQYYLREGANVADLRVNLVNKKDRSQQSHGLILRLRSDLDAIARKWNANIKMVELPAGPPVVATVVAEVYGRSDQPYSELRDAAKLVRQRLEKEVAVVDVDDSIEADQERYAYRIDKEKAALSGVSTEQAASTLELALQGRSAGILRVAEEVNPLMIELRLPREARASLETLRRITLKGTSGQMTTLGEIGTFETTLADKTIYHKNLERVAYVFADTAGRAPAEAILDIQADRQSDTVAVSEGDTSGEDATRDDGDGGRPLGSRSYLKNGAGIPWSVPEGIRVVWSGEGEWDITLRVFRDLGLAFAAALLGIYILLVYQTRSYFMTLILMI